MKDRNDKRPAQIMRKMAATVETVPYDMLAEFGHSYNPYLITAVILKICTPMRPITPMPTTLSSPCSISCGSIDLDHPNTQKAIEQLEIFFTSMGRPSPQEPSDRQDRISATFGTVHRAAAP